MAQEGRKCKTRLAEPTIRKRTALHLAVKKGHRAMAELLLKNGADIDATDQEDNKFIRVGWEDDYMDLYGEDDEDDGNDKERDSRPGETKSKITRRTLLHYAGIKGDEAMVRLLLENGAKVWNR